MILSFKNKILEIWKWTTCCRESRESPTEEAQQRRNEAAELFRSRRHVSVEDTISMHSELALPTTATAVRAQEEPEERREVLGDIFLTLWKLQTFV